MQAEEPDASSYYESDAMSATSYPWWVLLFALAVVAALGYSLVLLPHNIVLARELHEATQLDGAGQYAAAEPHFAAVLTSAPGSKRARLGMAHALFADDQPGNDLEGLRLIADLKLDRHDWEWLSPVMPEAYRNQFSEEKER